jgi:hypothetical protein
MQFAPSRGLPAQGYPNYQGDHVHQGGQAAHNPTIREQGWNPYGSTPARNLDENRYSGYPHQFTDVRMSNASPHLPQYDAGRFLGTTGWSGSLYHPPSNPPILNTSQAWGSYHHRSVQQQVMQPPSNRNQASGHTGAAGLSAFGALEPDWRRLHCFSRPATTPSPGLQQHI